VIIYINAKENLTFQRGRKQQAKGLADAWIKVDKVNECKVALRGEMEGGSYRERGRKGERKRQRERERERERAVVCMDAKSEEAYEDTYRVV
jgi:hypothetical protein